MRTLLGLNNLLNCICSLKIVSVGAEVERRNRSRRRKREWILPPSKLKENTDYTHREFIAKIRSDLDVKEKVEYFLTGEGADKEPLNLFVVDAETGFVRITGLLDREKIPIYNLNGVARYKNGSMAEERIPLQVTVLDENDNPPYFELHTGNITEMSKEGTFVMQIEGKDNDEAGTINSKIAYSIISQEPAGSGPMFTINKDTGKLYVKDFNLDRETHDFYKLVVKGTDLGGAAGGNTGTGTVEIHILDINDNVPTLEKQEYDGNVDENIADVVVLRVKALDKDLENTDNWLAVFHIIKGNEAGLFSVETDPKTNEGILKLIKAVDFEEVQKLEIGLLIENVAPFVIGSAVVMDVNVHVGEGGGGGGAGAGKSYPIKISVNNLPEGPKFKPTTKPVDVSEDPEQMPEDGVIATFAATDSDTGKKAENVNAVFFLHGSRSYAKAYDPDNWITVDPETAEIKLNKMPDRESKFVKNGTYTAKILCMTKDMPVKTSTGTIVIQVKDANDHCPTLSTASEKLCADQKTVYITGFDEDVKPNSAPFSFKVIAEGTRGHWEVEQVNETTAALHSRDALWPGVYEVTVEVADEPGLSCPSNEIFTVEVCTCVDDGNCLSRASSQKMTSSQISYGAISTLMAGLALLLRDSYKHVLNNSRYTQDVFATHTREDIYEEIALPVEFLDDYYSQKVMCASQSPPAQDSLLVYNYEGQGSPVGSVGCCSLLEADNDLQFLNDLGPKFKTLAEVCSPPKPPSPQVRRVVKTTPVPTQSESTVTNVSGSVTLPPPVQTILVQQQPPPLYYTVPPMMQPIQYIVEPQAHNTMLMADRSNMQSAYMVVQGSPRSPGSPNSPEMSAFPGSPGWASGGGWRVVGPSPDGSSLIIERQIGPGESQMASPVSPGSPRSAGWLQGSMPGGGWTVVGTGPGANFMTVPRQAKPGQAQPFSPELVAMEGETEELMEEGVALEMESREDHAGQEVQLNENISMVAQGSSREASPSGSDMSDQDDTEQPKEEDTSTCIQNELRM
ncbi:desmoglein-2.1-like [Aplochiton taeniatus]